MGSGDALARTRANSTTSCVWSPSSARRAASRVLLVTNDTPPLGQGAHTQTLRERERKLCARTPPPPISCRPSLPRVGWRNKRDRALQKKMVAFLPPAPFLYHLTACACRGTFEWGAREARGNLNPKPNKRLLQESG